MPLKEESIMGMLFKDAKTKAEYEELERLFVEQQRDDVLDEFDWTPGTVDLVEAGLEESNQQPLFGNTDCSMQIDCCKGHIEGGVQQYLDWFSDGEDSRYECN